MQHFKFILFFSSVPGVVSLCYGFISCTFCLVGLSFSWWMRFHLSMPNLSLDSYNNSFTYHGLIMILYYLVPALFSFLGNWSYCYYLCLYDFYSPRMNIMSFHFFLSSILPILMAIFNYPLGSAWTMYLPLSSKIPFSSVELMLFSIHLNSVSSVLGSLNSVISFVWVGFSLANPFVSAIIASSLLMLLSLPSFVVGTLFIILVRCSFVDLVSPELYMHLFWWFGHPEVYVVALPSMSTVSLTISTFSYLSGYYSIIYSIISISFLGMSVWAHHMFLDIDWDSRSFFSFMSILVGLPTGVKVFSWIFNIMGLSLTTNMDFPMTMSLLFISIFSFGGMTGLVVSLVGTNPFFHDTYYVVAHFHFVMSIAASLAFMLGCSYCLWQISKGATMLSSPLALVMIFSVLSVKTFIIMHYLGFEGMPRRYAKIYLSSLVMNRISSMLAMMNTVMVFMLAKEAKYNWTLPTLF